MAQTYNDLYLALRDLLRRAGVEACALEARLFLQQASGMDGGKLLANMRLYAPEDVAARANALAERRARGEPAAYITGSWEFYALPMLVSPAVLIPRTDTELLVSVALSLSEKREGLRILDLCCGSGCIGCAVAHALPGSRVLFADVSPQALELCRKNVVLNALASRSVCMRADALSPAPAGVTGYDLLLCNPPYIPSGELAELDASVRDWEPRLALDGGEDGLDFYRAVLAGWTGALSPGGWLLFELGEEQADSVSALMAAAGFGDIAAHRDTGGTERVLRGRKI